MRERLIGQPSFADLAFENKKLSHTKLLRIHALINWQPIQKLVRKYYHKAKKETGRLPHPPLVLFKMLLLQTWHGLSDDAVEEMVNDRLSFMRFCGLQLNELAPDATCLVRFRALLIKHNALDQLLTCINEDLEKRGIILKTGILVDASITDTSRKPKGKKTYQVAEKESKPAPKLSKGAHKEASWLNKSGKLRYGYKKHVAVDQSTGLILKLLTSKASAHESPYLPGLLNGLSLPKGTPIYTDKGYAGKPNASLLSRYGYRDRIQRKSSVNRPLSKNDRVYNKLIGKFRYRIEQVFGSIKRWFKSGVCRYVGLCKTHFQHLLEGIAYKLYRLDGLVHKGR